MRRIMGRFYEARHADPASPTQRGHHRGRRGTGYGGEVSDTLPMFPLNSVLFPGVSVPLHVFEDRYRALVHHLLRVSDPTDRVFGSVGIREGYEVGDHGAQSLYRVGCRVQLTEVESNADGSFDIVAVGLERIKLDRLDTSGLFPVGHVVDLPEPDAEVDEAVLERARATFTAYRTALAGFRADPYEGSLPRDPGYLSWTLAACAPLPMPERQSLLEADDAEERLLLVTDLLRAELRAMNVIPSLPATEVARTRWSPN
jgi:Lon protease-like protein